jgi:hypothetical protein
MADNFSPVRRTLIRLAVIIVILVSLSILWLAAGRQISLAADRFKTVEIKLTPIKAILYEGNGSDGTLHVDDLDLSLNASGPGELQVNIGTTKDNQLALSFAGKVFPFGSVRSTAEGENLATDVPASDHATVSIRHSAIAWPTPFETNFMTGHSPSWKRHMYYQITWEQSDGRKLEMLWRYEQYFYRTDGWANGFMTHEGSTGLIRVEISSDAR